MDISKCSYFVPSFSNKKMPCPERFDNSLFLINHPCRHLLFCKIIAVPYVDTNAKVTDFLPFCTQLLFCKIIVVPYVDTNAKVTYFLPFCTIGISMYQKSTLPYTLFLTYLPQAYSPLEHY